MPNPAQHSPDEERDTRAFISGKVFPMQNGPPIPWGLAQAIFDHLYRHRGQSLEELARRGGFGWGEVAYMWKDRRRTNYKHRERCLRDARAALAAAKQEPALWRCDSCGCEYTSNVGKCGQLAPPCDGTVRPVTRETLLEEQLAAIKRAAIEHGVNDEVGAAIAHAEVVLR